MIKCFCKTINFRYKDKTLKDLKNVWEHKYAIKLNYDNIRLDKIKSEARTKEMSTYIQNDVLKYIIQHKYRNMKLHFVKNPFKNDKKL